MQFLSTFHLLLLYASTPLHLFNNFNYKWLYSSHYLMLIDYWEVNPALFSVSHATLFCKNIVQ